MDDSCKVRTGNPAANLVLSWLSRIFLNLVLIAERKADNSCICMKCSLLAGTSCWAAILHSSLIRASKELKVSPWSRFIMFKRCKAKAGVNVDKYLFSSREIISSKVGLVGSGVPSGDECSRIFLSTKATADPASFLIKQRYITNTYSFLIPKRSQN